jgi:hypothetical protein
MDSPLANLNLYVAVNTSTHGWREKLLYMSAPFIHSTQKLYPLQGCCQFVSNDLKYTNTGSLKLIMVSNRSKKGNPWASYYFKAFMLNV